VHGAHWFRPSHRIEPPALQSWQRNLFAVWPSLFATSLGLMAMLPTLPLYVEERFNVTDPQELSELAAIIYAAAPLSAAVFGPVWGALGDRMGRKPMAIRANLAIAITTLMMPFATAPWVLLLLRIVQGALAGYVAPAMALVSSETPNERQGRLIGFLQVGMAIGSGIGPEVGWRVATQFGRGSEFYVTSALSLLAILPLWLFVHEKPRVHDPLAPSFVREMVHSCTQLLRNRVFAWLLVLVLLQRIGQNMMEPLLALFVRELEPWARLGTTPEERTGQATAFAFSILAVMQVFFTPMWGRLADRHGPLRCLGILSLGLGCLMFVVAATTQVATFLGLRTCAAAFMAGSMTLSYAAAGKRVVAARRTLAFSMVQSCMQFGFAFGPLVGAFVADRGTGTGPDFQRTFVAAALLCLVAGAGMLLLRRLPSGRLEHAPPVPPEGPSTP